MFVKTIELVIAQIQFSPCHVYIASNYYELSDEDNKFFVSTSKLSDTDIPPGYFYLSEFNIPVMKRMLNSLIEFAFIVRGYDVYSRKENN